MNRDEILKLEAGREMDALVATEVMGWKWCELHPDYESETITVKRLYSPGTFNHKWLIPAEKSTPRAHGWDENLQRYSINIAAAWEVVEKMCNTYGWDGANGFTVVHDKTVHIGWYVEFSQPSWEGATADTPELAICRAALLAVAGDFRRAHETD